MGLPWLATSHPRVTGWEGMRVVWEAGVLKQSVPTCLPVAPCFLVCLHLQKLFLPCLL